MKNKKKNNKNKEVGEKSVRVTRAVVTSASGYSSDHSEMAETDDAFSARGGVVPPAMFNMASFGRDEP